MLAKHLQNALEDRQLSQQTPFLREFADNTAALNKLLSSIPFKEIRPELKPALEEMASTLTHILNGAVETTEDGQQLSLMDVIKNYTTSSTQEPVLRLFFTSLVKYPESFRILIQELKLLAQDLNKYL